MSVGQPRQLRLFALAVVSTIAILYMLTTLEAQKPARSLHLSPVFGSSHSGSEASSALTATNPSPTTLTKVVSDLLNAAKSSPGKNARPISNSNKHRPAGAPGNGHLTDTLSPEKCLGYEQLQQQRQEPLSEGSRKFPYSRPSPECRTFTSDSLEKLLKRMKRVIKDPDLYRLFENSYPNTLDTTIKWRGFAQKIDPVSLNSTDTDEELAFVITGDINAMWLRDSASQIYSYLPLLEASTDPDSLASLWRGVINIQARYIIISPYCHSFQPPPESGIQPQQNGAYNNNNPQPPYDPLKVFDCKWELDSLASFLQILVAYYKTTGDFKFFQRYNWIEAVQAAVNAAAAMKLGTYASDGHVEHSAWTFTGYTNRGSETLTNDGLGNPTKANGMVRSAFRPSDDACIFQLLVPSNMMFAKYLESASLIMAQLQDARAENATASMRELAYGIRTGIDKDAIVHHRDFGEIFAYEVDGYGGSNLMDDANVPSLLAMPLWNFTESDFELPSGAKGRDYAKIYANTRKFVLSDNNPYFSKGPVLSAVGGPHLGPGKGWPMAAIVRAMTAYSPLLREKNPSIEAREQLRMVLDSTGSTGVIHESVNGFNANDWTRAWFGWANGLLGELILRIEEEETKKEGVGLLSESWQE